LPTLAASFDISSLAYAAILIAHIIFISDDLATPDTFLSTEMRDYRLSLVAWLKRRLPPLSLPGAFRRFHGFRRAGFTLLLRRRRSGFLQRPKDEAILIASAGLAAISAFFSFRLSAAFRCRQLSFARLAFHFGWLPNIEPFSPALRQSASMLKQLPKPPPKPATERRCHISISRLAFISRRLFHYAISLTLITPLPDCFHIAYAMMSFVFILPIPHFMPA
jgi:hypothetical protein